MQGNPIKDNERWASRPVWTKTTPAFALIGPGQAAAASRRLAPRFALGFAGVTRSARKLPV
jgi:hypothetical protein